MVLSDRTTDWTIIKRSFEQNTSDFTKKLMKFQKRKTMLVCLKIEKNLLLYKYTQNVHIGSLQPQEKFRSFLHILGVEFWCLVSFRFFFSVGLTKDLKKYPAKMEMYLETRFLGKEWRPSAKYRWINIPPPKKRKNESSQPDNISGCQSCSPPLGCRIYPLSSCLPHFLHTWLLQNKNVCLLKKLIFELAYGTEPLEVEEYFRKRISFFSFFSSYRILNLKYIFFFHFLNFEIQTNLCRVVFQILCQSYGEK